MQKIAAFIADERKKSGLTQKELAAKMGVTDKAVSKWERGLAFPDISSASLLASLLHCSITELLSGERTDLSESSNACVKKETDTVFSISRCKDGEVFDISTPGTSAVSPLLFGNNLEHTRADIYGGLSAEILKNRKFAGKPLNLGCADHWHPFGKATCCSFDEKTPYTRHSDTGYHMNRKLECNAQSVVITAESESGGILQREISVQKGREYVFATVAKIAAVAKCGGKNSTLVVSLCKRKTEKPFAKAEILLDSEEWKRYEVVLTPGVTEEDADLRLTLSGKTAVTFGALSLMPKENFRGMRPDVIERLRELGTTVLRWPGGNFAGEYCWFDSLLPRDMRAPFESYMGIETQPQGGCYDNHELSVDDFIALCEKIGAEPYITINSAWNTPEENAALVEYCNGDETTAYGKLRAERGHSEPYGVSFWSLGNEVGYGHMEGDNTPYGYCRIARANAEAMLAVSPDITLCSSGQYAKPEWAVHCANPLKKVAKLVSYHYYNDKLRIASFDELKTKYEQCISFADRCRYRLRELRKRLDPELSISFDEWNTWYEWYTPTNVYAGIFASLMFHIILAEADSLGIGLCCHFEAVNEGLVSVTPTGASLTAQGKIFTLMKEHAGGRIALARDEVLATEKDGVTTVTVVNSSFDEEKDYAFTSRGRCLLAKLFYGKEILPPSDFEEQNAEYSADGEKTVFRIPPHSVLFAKFG